MRTSFGWIHITIFNSDFPLTITAIQIVLTDLNETYLHINITINMSFITEAACKNISFLCGWGRGGCRKVKFPSYSSEHCHHAQHSSATDFAIKFLSLQGHQGPPALLGQ